MLDRAIVGGLAIVGLCGWPSSVIAAAVSVVVENTSSADRPAGPATFGMVFARGDAKGAMKLGDLPTQFDVKRHWPDGSIKHAIVTVQLPALAEGARQKQEFIPGKPVSDTKPPDVKTDLKNLADVVVRFRIHNGPAESVSLAKTIQSTPPDRLWLAGPLVREWHFKAAPVDEKGAPDPDLEVRFEVRHYPAAKTARVAVIVENGHWTTPGNIPYDVKILIGDKEAYAKQEVGRFEVDGNNQRLKAPEQYLGHAAGGRWIKRFWVGPGKEAARPLEDAHVRYDVAYLATTGLLPKYDPTLTVPEEVLAGMLKRWQEAATDIMQNGFIRPYFPGTGGREDIGPLPAWTARYIVSQDPRALKVTLGNGDLGASCPVHLRDGKTGWTVSLDDHPGFSFNSGGTLERAKPRDAAGTPWILPAKSQFALDSAHQASLAYVPYLVTGDFFYLEELQFWANWNMLAMHQGYREKGRGLLTSSIQSRGVAWALRQIIHAAAITPDDAANKSKAEYFEARLLGNLRYYRDFLDGKLDFKPVPTGAFPPFAGNAYGDTPEIRDKYRTTAGWMHNFMAWSFIHAVEQGYTDAIPARDYFVKLCIGSITHPGDIPPFAGTAYFLPLAERGSDGKLSFYQSWKEVKEGFGKMGAKLPSTPAYPGYGGSYSYIARGILIESARANLPGAAAALRWLNSQLPNRRRVLSSDPTWAFIPVEE
jgi:hypothetical protein